MDTSRRTGAGRALPVRVLALWTGAMLFVSGALATVGFASAIPANGAATYLFSDGFESGTFSAWSQASAGLRAQQAVVRVGAWAARGTASGVPAYARTSLSSRQADL